MKPTLEKFTQAVETMAAVIPFFPKSTISKLLIAQVIEAFVSDNEQLDWLTLTACSHIRDWERSGGLVELRGLFCTRFMPADQIEASCTTSGFSPHELEMRGILAETIESQGRFEKYQRERLTARPEDGEPFQLPKPKGIPEPGKSKRQLPPK